MSALEAQGWALPPSPALRRRGEPAGRMSWARGGGGGATRLWRVASALPAPVCPSPGSCTRRQMWLCSGQALGTRRSSKDLLPPSRVSLCPRGQWGGCGGALRVCYKGPITVTGLHPRDPVASQRPCLPTPSLWGLGFDM